MSNFQSSKKIKNRKFRSVATRIAFAPGQITKNPIHRNAKFHIKEDAIYWLDPGQKTLL